ncbi:MAG TPA: ABC transporter permease [Gammaproteobacteria bacterium]|jgi:ABC-2 type transport system permease protein|nr:ABC transporter permease [Gammaproteobacteria bacterium]
MLNRTGFYPTLIALQTLTSKEVLRFLRIWSQTLLPPAITMSLYFIIFGKFIGSQIHDIHGYVYIQYIAPGLIMMSVMTNAYANTSSSFFLNKLNKSIEEMIVSPMPSWIILLGFTCGGMLRGILVGAIVTMITLLFTRMPITYPMMIIGMTLLAAMVFSLAGLINGIFAKRFDDISFIPTFVLTPLTYLGGIFYSIHQLPAPWPTISLFNPILSMVDTFRYGFLGITDINIYVGFSLVGGLAVGLFVWAWWLLERGTGVKV